MSLDGKPRIRGVHHIAVPVQDMKQSLEFYCGILGLKVKTSTRDSQALSKAGQETGLIADVTSNLDLFYNLDLGNGTVLTLVEFPNDTVSPHPSSFAATLWPGDRSASPLGGVDHFAMNVDTEEDLLYYWNRLRDHGYEVSEVQRLEVSPFWKQFFLYDPNGLAIEITTWDLADPKWATRDVGALLTDPDPIEVDVSVESV